MKAPSCWAAKVRRLEGGFFTKHDDLPGQMGAQFSTRPVDGMPVTTQFFRVQVDLEDTSSPGAEIWVVCVAIRTGIREPPPQKESFDETTLGQVRAALAVAFPGATMCFTTEDREGFSRVVGDPERAPAIAAAVAVVKYYAAWDESDPIGVTVGDAQFSVSVAFSKNAYRTAVRWA